jgi:hypothetical protein
MDLTPSIYCDEIYNLNADYDEFTYLLRSLSTYEPCEMSGIVGADVGNEQSYINILDVVLQGQDEHNQLMENNPPMVKNQFSDPHVQVINEVEQPMQPTRAFNDSPASITMGTKPQQGRPIILKPLIDLTTESMDNDNVKETKKRRGRKRIDTCPTTTAPINASTGGLSSGKKTKKQKMLEEAAEKNEEVVCFGNQVVLKETPEYKSKREQNNEAVKKFREKKAQENLEREEKIPKLHKENDDLKTNLDSLVKGINELKENILLFNRGRNLPDDILNLLKQFDNECKDVGILF